MELSGSQLHKSRSFAGFPTPLCHLNCYLKPQNRMQVISVRHSLFRMSVSTGESSAHLLSVCTHSPSLVTPLRKLTLNMQGLKQAHLRVSTFSEQHLLKSGAQHGNPASRKAQPKERETVRDSVCILCCKPCTHTVLSLFPQLIQPSSWSTIKLDQSRTSQEQARGFHLCGVPENCKETLLDLPHQLQTRAEVLCFQKLKRSSQVLVLQQGFLCNSRPTKSFCIPQSRAETKSLALVMKPATAT